MRTVRLFLVAVVLGMSLSAPLLIGPPAVAALSFHLATPPIPGGGQDPTLWKCDVLNLSSENIVVSVDLFNEASLSMLTVFEEGGCQDMTIGPGGVGSCATHTGGLDPAVLFAYCVIRAPGSPATTNLRGTFTSTFGPGVASQFLIHTNYTTEAQ